MKTATFNRGFFAFLGIVLVGVAFAIAFTTPARSSHTIGKTTPGAAMDGGYTAIEPANAPPVIEARLLPDSEIISEAPLATDMSASAAAL